MIMKTIDQKKLYEGTPSSVEYFYINVCYDRPRGVFCQGLSGAEVVTVDFLTEGNDPENALEADWMPVYLSSILQEISATHNLLYIELPGTYRLGTPASTVNPIKLGVNE